MEDLTKQQMKKTQDIMIKLTGGTMSTSEYDSTTKGFFAQDEGSKPFEIGFKDIPEMPEGLNNNIQRMYKIIGDPDKEVYIGYWTIMSLEKIKNPFNLMKEAYKKDNIIYFAFM